MRAWLLYEINRTDMRSLGELCENWDIALDKCVFGANGLRMICNRKAGICPTCKGVPFQKWITEKHAKTATKCRIVDRTDIEPCSTCNTFDRKVDQGRPYDVLAIVDCDNASDEFQKLSDLIVALEYTSIRVICPNVQAMFVELSHEILTRIAPWNAKTIKTINAMRPIRSKDTAFKCKRGLGHDATSLMSVDTDDKAFLVLSEYVSDHMNCKITSLKTNPSRNFFIICTNSKECGNKGSAHGRSTVYFLFYPDGYYQKCWSRKNTIHHPGGVSCEHYKSCIIRYSNATCAANIRQLFSKRCIEKFPPIMDRTNTASSVATSFGDCTTTKFQVFGNARPLLYMTLYPKLKEYTFSEGIKVLGNNWHNVQDSSSTTTTTTK